ncbi:MAG: HAD family hydrolase, partial [Lachnospiraceae bacterium]|nr:HAD family hydrolase [Lachnospiraceae bacterium]
LAEAKQAGYRMAVVSNKPDQAVKQLGAKFFGEYVREFHGDREGSQRKPAPDMVYRALNELGSEARRAVYVGDSEVDLQTAANVPMICISVTWGFRTDEQLFAAGARKENMIKTPQELLPLLARLQRAE